LEGSSQGATFPCGQAQIGWPLSAKCQHVGLKRKNVLGCLYSLAVFTGGSLLAALLWMFRKPISRHFFDSESYGSLIGLLILVAVPFLSYVGYMLFRKVG
jgi:Na+-driven multidrug efflux pump